MLVSVRQQAVSDNKLNSTSPNFTMDVDKAFNVKSYEFPVTGNVGNSSGDDPSKEAFDNLFPALLQCFALIFAGYFAGRINLVTQSQGRGIGIFVGSFAMPAMLFKSMCELHFSDVNWHFLLAIFIAKVVVFLAVILFTLLLVRPVHTGKMGIYGVFATQSHDFALGIPIVQALYSVTHPDFEKYLYLIAPISVTFLNPIGFLLLEVHKWRVAPSSNRISHCRMVVKVLAGVFTNPIVFMTLLGIVGNFVFHQKVPPTLDPLLIVLKQAFSATALFCLGLSMVGRIGNQGTQPGFISISLLIAAKMLLTPFLTRGLVVVLSASNATITNAFSTYGFLYGTFPTAPSVFIYASQYSTEVEMMATGMVVTTFLAAPVMFISARLMTLPDTSEGKFRELLNITSLDISIVGIIACVWVLVVFTIHRRLGAIPHRFTMGLLLSQIVTCVGMILWSTLDMTVLWQQYLHLTLFLVGIYSTRFWMTGIAATVCLLRLRSLCYVLRVKGWIVLYSVGLPVLIVGLLLMIGHRDQNANIPAFEYSYGQQIVAIIVLSVNLILTIVALSIQHRHRPVCQRSPGRGDCWQEAPPTSPGPTNDSPAELPAQTADVEIRPSGNGIVTAVGRSKAVRVKRPRLKNPKMQCDSCTDCGNCSTSAPVRPVTTNIEDLIPDVVVRRPRTHNDSEVSETECFLESTTTSEQSCLLSSRCDTQRRTTCAQLLQTYDPKRFALDEDDEEELAILEERDEFQMTRHIVLTLLLLMSVFVGLCLNLWRLMNEAMTGIYVEIEFLDSVFTFGQGLFTFAVFGLDSQMVIEPLLNRIKHSMSRRWPSFAERFRRKKVQVPDLENLPPDVRITCVQFLRYHRDRCVQDIVRDSSRGAHTYQAVFTGRNMIEWLIEVGLANDRAEGLKYSRQLLNGGVVEHVHQEHHFFDLPYLYHFTDTP